MNMKITAILPERKKSSPIMDPPRTSKFYPLLYLIRELSRWGKVFLAGNPVSLRKEKFVVSFFLEFTGKRKTGGRGGQIYDRC